MELEELLDKMSLEDSKDTNPHTREYQNKVLKQLAMELAKNRFTASFNLGDKKESKIAKEALKDIFRDPAEGGFTSKSRNILVVGAGASKSCYNLKNGNEALQDIKKHFQLDSAFDAKKPKDKENVRKIADYVYNNIIEEKDKVNRLNQSFDEDKLDFETSLSLIAKYVGIKEIREKIQEIYNYRYFPSLLYDIIAHLLRHKFLDVVINFNFDELLDQAIEEEIISDRKYILSDGDCNNYNDLFFKNAINVPLYIKPHGTASHKSTMRFTKDDYLEIPRDTKNFLSMLFKGFLKNPEESSIETVDNERDISIDRINVIIIGFDMASVEFTQILEESIRENSEDVKKKTSYRFYYFDFQNVKEKSHYKRSEELRNKLLQATYTKRFKTLLELDKNTDIKVNPIVVTRDHDLTSIFETLFEGISKNYTPAYEPRGLWRNKIIESLFYNSSQQRIRKKNDESSYKEKNEHYYLTRTATEILIATSVDKGILYINKAINGRVGKYYDLYRNITGESRVSFFKLLDDMGFMNHPLYTRDIWVHETIYKELYESNNPNNSKSLLAKMDFAADVIIKVIRKLDKDYRKVKLNIQYEVLKGYFLELLKRNNYSISPEFGTRRFLLEEGFTKDIILNTRLVFKVYLNHTISQFKKESEKDDKSRLLLCITRGNLLFSELYGKEKLTLKGHLDKVRMILSDPLLDSLFTKHDFPRDQLKYIPFPYHSYSLIIRLGKTNGKHESSLNKNGFELKEIIVFRLPKFGKVITPIYHRNGYKTSKKERSFFTKLFHEYWEKGTSYEEHVRMNNPDEVKSIPFLSGNEKDRYKKWIERDFK